MYHFVGPSSRTIVTGATDNVGGSVSDSAILTRFGDTSHLGAYELSLMHLIRMGDVHSAQNGDEPSEPPHILPWLRATLDDVSDLDFEAPIAEFESADSQEIADIFRRAANPGNDNEVPDTPPGGWVFATLWDVMDDFIFKTAESSGERSCSLMGAGRLCQPIFAGSPSNCSRTWRNARGTPSSARDLQMSVGS